MSGISTLTGCKAPTVKGDIDSCVTSLKFGVAKCGARNLDYQTERKTVGEWKDVSKLITKPIQEMPDMVCIGLEDWLTRVKPTLKEGHDFWKDKGGKTKNKQSTYSDGDTITDPH